MPTYRPNLPLAASSACTATALLVRVDRFAEHMREQLAGSRFARTEAVQVLLSRTIDQVEAEHKKGSKRSPAHSRKGISDFTASASAFS